MTKQLPIVFLFAAVLLVPAGAFANNIEDTNDYNYDNKLEPDHMDTANPYQANIDTNLTDLNAAHSKVTNIMIIQNETPLEGSVKTRVASVICKFSVVFNIK